MNDRFPVTIGLIMLGLLVSCTTGAPTRSEISLPPDDTTTPAALVLTEPHADEEQPGETVGVVELASFDVAFDEPFAETDPNTWKSSTFEGKDVDLPLMVDDVVNRFVLNGLTPAQETFLIENGFVVMHSEEEQFHHIRDQVSDTYGQPYFLSTDAAFHALHLTFDDLLEALEKEWIRQRIMDITEATLTELLTYRPQFEGTQLESELDDSIAYLSVALRLFDESYVVDPDVEEIIDAQIGQILEGDGLQNSVLIPDFEDDYGAYKPVGHYAGDPELESYFRAMSWLGRVNFPLEDETSSRLPLFVTLALRKAEIDGESASSAWAQIHEVLTFLIGPSDDPGPPELAALMDEVYGSTPAPRDLADDDRWSTLVQMRDRLPQPRINSLFVAFLEQTEAKVGWRFFGQRFTLDGFILQNLIFNHVQDKPSGERRWLPTGLDVMAALGSNPAMELLEELGETEYPKYSEQMATLQEVVQAQTREQWQSGFYDSWLYAFLPVLEPKGDAYPSVMRTKAWNTREMNSCLGSWAELKHDTILYAKMPEGAGGGGPPCTSSAPPVYLEANPEAFYRMAYVANVIADGLRERIIIPGLANEWCFPDSLVGYNTCMADLGTRFSALGDLAAKELSGEPLEDQDYGLIQACLGPQECFGISQELYSGEGMEPLPIVAAVAGSKIGVLEAATGYVDRIFVIVPIDGRLYAAQGGVYSYYEFIQPREDRLTDEAWRERLSGPNPPSLPSWSKNFVFDGGGTTNVTGFYIGAAYDITELGDGVKLRQEPSMASSFTSELKFMGIVQITDGPVINDDFTWWEFEDCSTGDRGWAIQDGRWFDYASY